MLNEKTTIRDFIPPEPQWVPATSEKPKPKQPETLTVKEAMGLNRHQRRILGKLNGIKIPGSMKPYVRPKQNVY